MFRKNSENPKKEKNYIESFKSIFYKGLITLTGITVLTLAGVNYARNTNNDLDFLNASDSILNKFVLKLHQNSDSIKSTFLDSNNDGLINLVYSGNMSTEDRDSDGVFDYLKKVDEFSITEAYDRNNDGDLDKIVLTSLDDIGGTVTITSTDTNFDGFADFYESKIIQYLDGLKFTKNIEEITYTFRDTNHSGIYDFYDKEIKVVDLFFESKKKEVDQDSKDFGVVEPINYSFLK